MLKKNFLILGTMTLLLSSTLFGNEISPCPTCFVNLSGLKPSVDVEVKIETLEESVEKEIFNDSENLVIVDLLEGINNILFEEDPLPVTEFYCEYNTVLVYEIDSEVFSCV